MAIATGRHSIIVTAAVVALCVAAVWLFDDPLWDNETQRMAVVKHFLDPSWIPNDWFLNTPMVYQIPFNLIAAPFVSLLDLGTATILLRLVLHFWFATGVAALAKRLGIGLVALIPAVMFAVSPRTNYLATSEWMVGHAEAKVVAYGAILWALSFIVGRRYTYAAALLGLATTFHVLVGLYAVFSCTIFVMVHPRHRRPFLDSLTTSLPLFLLTGSFGFLTIAQNLLSDGRGDPFTDLIYVARNTHHAWPPAWSRHVHLYLPDWIDKYAWLAKTVLSLSLLILVAVKSRSRSFREYAQLALSTAPLFLVGLVLYGIGPIGLLKYLPFRVPDVLIPFAAFLLFFGEIERSSIGEREHWLRFSGRRALRIGLLCVASVGVFAGIHKIASDLRVKVSADVPWAFVRLAPEDRNMMMWIRENTPADALFLADPQLSQFYITAERGMLVSWKHFPQNEGDVREWHDRLVALNRGRKIISDPSGIDLDRIQFSFETLPLETAKSLAEQYDLDFYYGPAREDWPIDPLHRSHRKAVYRLRQQTESRYN